MVWHLCFFLFLQVPFGANGCAYFPFEELCDRPLGAADYFGLFSKLSVFPFYLCGEKLNFFIGRIIGFHVIVVFYNLISNFAPLPCRKFSYTCAGWGAKIWDPQQDCSISLCHIG